MCDLPFSLWCQINSYSWPRSPTPSLGSEEERCRLEEWAPLFEEEDRERRQAEEEAAERRQQERRLALEQEEAEEEEEARVQDALVELIAAEGAEEQQGCAGGAIVSNGAGKHNEGGEPDPKRQRRA